MYTIFTDHSWFIFFFSPFFLVCVCMSELRIFYLVPRLNDTREERRQKKITRLVCIHTRKNVFLLYICRTQSYMNAENNNNNNKIVLRITHENKRNQIKKGAMFDNFHLEFMTSHCPSYKYFISLLWYELCVYVCECECAWRCEYVKLRYIHSVAKTHSMWLLLTTQPFAVCHRLFGHSKRLIDRNIPTGTRKEMSWSQRKNTHITTTIATAVTFRCRAREESWIVRGIKKKYTDTHTHQIELTERQREGIKSQHHCPALYCIKCMVYI